MKKWWFHALILFERIIFLKNAVYNLCNLKNRYIALPDLKKCFCTLMNDSIVLGLIQNIAILLSFAMLYENFWLPNNLTRSFLPNVLTGLILGGICIVLMFTTWPLAPGLVFDARSVMLTIAGLFFGVIPTLIAMAAASVVRYIMGGDGMWMGISVVLFSGSAGIFWRVLRKDWQTKNLKTELLVLGVVVHLA